MAGGIADNRIAKWERQALGELWVGEDSVDRGDSGDEQRSMRSRWVPTGNLYAEAVTL